MYVDTHKLATHSHTVFFLSTFRAVHFTPQVCLYTTDLLYCAFTPFLELYFKNNDITPSFLISGKGARRSLFSRSFSVAGSSSSSTELRKRKGDSWQWHGHSAKKSKGRCFCIILLGVVDPSFMLLLNVRIHTKIIYKYCS